MKTVIADATLADELKKTTSPVEIVTADGSPLGTFRPPPVRPFPEPAISDEELLQAGDRPERQVVHGRGGRGQDEGVASYWRT